MYILPKTKLGWQSFWLFVAALVVPFFVTTMISIFDTGRWVHVAMLLAWLMLTASGISAIVSWFKKDRAVILILPVAQLVFWMLFLLGEVLFPH